MKRRHVIFSTAMTLGLLMLIDADGLTALAITPSGSVELDAAGFEISDPVSFRYDRFRDRFLVLDAGRSQVVVIERSGELRCIHRFDTAFASPVALAVSEKGDLFVAGENSDSIVIIPDYDSDTAVSSRIISLGPGDPLHRKGTDAPRSLSLAPDGRLFVVDAHHRGVSTYSQTGEFLQSWEHLGFATRLRTGSNGILVANARVGGIIVADLEGRIQRRLGVRPERYRSPVYALSMASDRRGRIWVIEESGALTVLDPSDRVLLSLPPDAFLHAVDIEIGAQDEVYVLDRGARRIAVFVPGETGTRAGSWGRP